MTAVAETSTDLRCARCGGPTSLGSAVITVGMCAHPCNTRHAKAANHADSVFCGRPCASAAGARAQVERADCIVCGTRIDMSHLHAPDGSRLAGRPPKYCSDQCRLWVRKQLRTAERELARDKFADAVDVLEAQLRRARMLAAAWSGASRGDEESSAAPSDLALQRLRERLEELGRLIGQARERAWQDEQRRVQAEESATHKARAAQQAVLESQWRSELEAR